MQRSVVVRCSVLILDTHTYGKNPYLAACFFQPVIARVSIPGDMMQGNK